MVSPTVENLMASNPAYWADKSRIQLQSAIFSFTDHEYQIEPMSSDVKRRCYMKAAQGGWTEIEVLRTIQGQIYGKYPTGVLYLFPTGDDVSEFSKSRFGPLIADNYEAIGKYITGTDSVSIKKVGSSLLYLRGARLSQSIDGVQKESSKLRSIPVDAVKFDERDLMDDLAIAKALSRMGHSKVKEEVHLATPTIPDYGIDKVWQSSDQRYWFIKCQKCNTETCLEIDFPECIKIRNDGTGFRACKKCGQEIFSRDGHYIAKYPDRTDMIGWRWSQLNSAYVDPGTILKAYNDPPQNNIGDVYRLMLGMPYIESSARLTIQSVYQCCGLDPMKTSATGPCAMGIDVGKILHVVIGRKLNNKQHELVKIARLDTWNEVHDLARKFDIRCCVPDSMPEIHAVKAFREQEPYEVIPCRYSDTLQTGTNWDMQKGIVTVNRTEITDETHSLVMTPKQLLLPRLCSEIEEFAAEMTSIAKVPERDAFTGAIKQRYKALGADHYRHALNYYLLASKRISPIISEYSSNIQTQADCDYSSLG